MQFENRNALVLLDNAPCHPEMELYNVKLVFLPPNTTAGTQPLDIWYHPKLQGQISKDAS